MKTDHLLGHSVNACLSEIFWIAKDMVTLLEVGLICWGGGEIRKYEDKEDSIIYWNGASKFPQHFFRCELIVSRVVIINPQTQGTWGIQSCSLLQCFISSPILGSSWLQMWQFVLKLKEFRIWNDFFDLVQLLQQDFFTRNFVFFRSLASFWFRSFCYWCVFPRRIIFVIIVVITVVWMNFRLDFFFCFSDF